MPTRKIRDFFAVSFSMFPWKALERLSFSKEKVPNKRLRFSDTENKVIINIQRVTLENTSKELLYPKLTIMSL